MARFCPNCGTEVEDPAVFCPTCGQPIDQDVETQMPAAPAWPDQPAAGPEAGAPEPEPISTARPEDDLPPRRFEEPTRAEEAPPPLAASPGPRTEPDRSLPRPEGPTPAPISLPFTMPVTLSAWLIGGGAVLGALGALISLFDGFANPVDLILLVILVGIAATVFFSASVPHIPHLRLATLVVVLIGFGMALDRIGFGAAGVGELLLFLGTAAAGIGAIILELGRDQPLGGPQT